jgi:hypothetical protein
VGSPGSRAWASPRRGPALGPSALLTAALLVAGCATTQPPAPEVATRAAPALVPPGIRGFEGPPAAVPLPSNEELAQDFMDLTFRMESGARIPVLTRYEAPIRVGLAGPVPETLDADLDALLARLVGEAGLDIRRARGAANLVVEVVPLPEMREMVPEAACFVVPGVTSWEEYRRERRAPVTDWTRLRVRERTAVFVPDAIPPQELRDCLHEELAQAVGPLGDLWRLPGSVFNDDNLQGVLTSSDMVMLRATYAPELASGMTEAQVAARLPEVLGRLNPAGGAVRAVGVRGASRAFDRAIEAALAESRERDARRSDARRAARLARSEGRAAEGFALYALGRLSVAEDDRGAARAFERAALLYDADPRTRIHEAHVGLQRAALALRMGDAEGARAIARWHADAAALSQNAALLSTLRLVEAEALDVLGRAEEARGARADGLAWARYGFGPEAAVRERLAEIAALAPDRGSGS